MSLLELFCSIDDFWQNFRTIWQQHLLESGEVQRIRATKLSESEIMTLLIQFHTSRFRNFKAFSGLLSLPEQAIRFTSG